MAEGSRLDLSLHQVGRIHVLSRHSVVHTLLSVACSTYSFGSRARVATDWSWWLERSGPTRSHSEHGSETLQRPRYWGHQAPGK